MTTEWTKEISNWESEYLTMNNNLSKRTTQLETKQSELQEGTEEWSKLSDQLHYLRGCKETIEYLMTGQLPNDGNHDGMKHHKPHRHNDLGSLD